MTEAEEQAPENGVAEIMDAIDDVRLEIKAMQQARKMQHRSLSLAITKLDEATLWLDHYYRNEDHNG